MALIQWHDNLSVNVAEIDRQHQQLIEMINELHAAMSQGKGREAVGSIISRLVGYATTHFQTEEKYFEKFGYPDTPAHKQEHTDFSNKVAEFREGFASGKMRLSIEVMNFLSDWLKHHIQVVDKEYAPFFNQNGLA